MLSSKTSRFRCTDDRVGCTYHLYDENFPHKNIDSSIYIVMASIHAVNMYENENRYTKPRPEACS